MSSKRAGGLGRGLGALFDDSSYAKEVAVHSEPVSHPDDASLIKEGVVHLSINDIRPNASQPRKIFDESKIDELSESIRLHGLIQPIIVRPIENGFEIVAGERRWRAARKAELSAIPCIVRELDDKDNMLLAIIENMQREDLNPIEEALAFDSVIAQYGFSQEDISKSVGKSRPYIANALRLLKLPEEVKSLVSDGRLSGGHARAILAVSDSNRQIELANMCLESGLSVRALEAMISDSEATKVKHSRKNLDASRSPELRSIENSLKDITGTKIKISSDGQKGKIEFRFFSSDEFERLIDLFRTIKQ